MWLPPVPCTVTHVHTDITHPTNTQRHTHSYTHHTHSFLIHIYLLTFTHTEKLPHALTHSHSSTHTQLLFIFIVTVLRYLTESTSGKKGLF